MNLPIPVPSQTGGPQYAQDEVSCFNQIDSHNHTSGQGVQIPLDGLNINQNLDMNNYSVTNLKSLQLNNSLVSPGSSSLFMLGNNLYFRDGTNSFDVQITSGASVNVPGSAGFTGLPSGTASAAFLPGSGTFRFESATNTGATTDIGPLKLRNAVASSNAVTITPSNPTNNYTLTLPNDKPASSSFVVCSNTGGLSFQPTSFILPAGSLIMYGGTSVPTGWLFCDGSVVSQTTYSALFAAVGTAFDTGGEGAGNFRLPDMRRRAAVGAGGTGSVTLGNAVGNSGGAETVTLSITEIPSHNHGGSTGSSTINVDYYTSNPTTQNQPTLSTNVSSLTTRTLLGSAHTHTISSEGGGGAHNNIQPSLVVNYIIKY